MAPGGPVAVEAPEALPPHPIEVGGVSEQLLQGLRGQVETFPDPEEVQSLGQRRNSSAICPVHEGVCLGCHMNILPQQFIDLQKGLEILQCPHCQRI
ncbi:MAG: hypothetical protein KKF43_14045, partial [Proteobacteria bacterium]|nr:hypothetical protein [Pseudomonadota bacterium]